MRWIKKISKQNITFSFCNSQSVFSQAMNSVGLIQELQPKAYVFFRLSTCKLFQEPAHFIVVHRVRSQAFPAQQKSFPHRCA